MLVPEVLTLTMNPALDVVTSIDRVIPTHKLRCNHSTEHPGGGGVNVASVLHRFGSNVQALYPIGGVTGRWIDSLTKAEGLNTLLVQISGETRESFSVHEISTAQDYRFILPGPMLTPAEVKQFMKTLSLNWPSKYIVISGGLPPGVADDFYVAVIQLSKERGLKVFFDSNGPALRPSLEEGVYLFKPSLSELNSLSPSPMNGQSEYLFFCRSLIRQKKAEIIALSLGEQGAMLVTEAKAWYAPSIEVQIKTTIGAGDSFVGAMTWSLSQGHNLETAFAYGMAGGAAALLHSGTSLCQPNDAKELIHKVKLIPLN
jgi:6-phosphofructokinase 2